MLCRSISRTLRQLIARDVAKTRATPVGGGPSDLRGHEVLNSPSVDAGWRWGLMGSLLGPTKRNARLKWSVQCDTTLVNQDRILKNVPQRRGPSGVNLTLEERAA